MDESMLQKILPKLMDGRPTTYHYSKALAEHILAKEGANLPIALVRPSIVTAAFKEPMPGWVDGVNGPSTFIIMDEVEKLAYQLNEEAERTERPIRRLSKVMYGSTCADMQVDVMGECLSSIKHVVGTTSGCFYPRSNHWEVGGRPQCDKCGCRVRIAHSIVSRLWRQFQTTVTAIRGFSSGRPRGTTPADDRYIVLQARKNRRQTAGEIARHSTQATGRPISRFTEARRLHGGGLFARRPVRCVPLTPAHRRRRSLWCREHRNWRDNEWGRVLFTDESRFSLSSDSHRILIWRERGSRNHPSNIIERDRYGGRGVLVWGGIMLGSRTDLHIFDAGLVNGTRYCNQIFLPYVRLFRGAMGLQFLFMDDNAPCHGTVAAEQLLESEDIERMDWPARSPDLNPIDCQVIYSQFGLAIHQNDHQARRRFVEWAQNEIAVVPDFHKRILFSNEAHFWLNGYVNKQNCRIWSEAYPQVYVETPLHPEKLTVWCALWAGGILLQKR
ncbi:transposable element Tc1 transposase [Trichonephila clavipes]|nr:transposable element Tc1 transposase [Trichonephila clavipes]